MTHLFRLKLLALAISSTLITACGDAETNIVEKDPIETPDDGHDHGEDHDHGDDHAIDSMGRLAVLAANSNEANIFDLDDNSLLESFTLTHDSNSLNVSHTSTTSSLFTIHYFPSTFLIIYSRIDTIFLKYLKEGSGMGYSTMI